MFNAFCPRLRFLLNLAAFRSLQSLPPLLVLPLQNLRSVKFYAVKHVLSAVFIALQAQTQIINSRYKPSLSKAELTRL